MKKSVYFLLGALCVPIVGCGNKEAKNADLFYAYSTENLMADWDYMDKENEENEPFWDRDYTMRFNTLRNENDGMQLMIHANKNIDSFDFELPKLKTDAGVELDTSNFTVAAEWYQNVEVSKETTAYTGYYPDALIPLANYKFRRMDQIEKGRNQGLYFNLFTPEDAKPGLYKGEGTLTLDDQKYKIPFEVNVYDAALPNAEHLRTCILIWYQCIAFGEGKNESPELHEAYYNFLASKRMAPGYFPDHIANKPINDWVDYYYEHIVKNPMISNYRLAEAGAGESFKIEKATQYLEALLKKNIDLRKNGTDPEANMFDKLMFYIDDEPSPERYPTVKKHDKDLYDAKKALVEKYKSDLDIYPDIRTSLMHVQNLVTVEYNDQLVATDTTGGVQTWCPQLQNFQSSADRAKYLERQSSTDRTDSPENVWWYVCESPNNPYPNYHLDGKLLYTRTMKYMQYAYQINGEVHWNICYYQKEKAGFTMGRDIWYDPLTWEKCNCDGFMCYPGKDFGIYGPITTLRLESIMNANEEYEYQWMIDQKVQEFNAKYGKNYDTKELLKKFYADMFKNVMTICDDKEFNEIRVDIMKTIETLYSDLDAGMALLGAAK